MFMKKHFNKKNIFNFGTSTMVLAYTAVGMKRKQIISI